MDTCTRIKPDGTREIVTAPLPRQCPRCYRFTRAIKHMCSVCHCELLIVEEIIDPDEVDTVA